MTEKELSSKSLIVRLTLYIVLIFAAVFTCSFFGVLVRSLITDQLWMDVAQEHASVVIGLPISTVTAFLLVSILRITDGKIEFEGLGFKFRGASGPLVLWIACFIAQVIGIRLLW